MAEAALLVIDPVLTGHHIRYIEWIVQGAVARGMPVVLVTDACNQGHERLRVLQEASGGSLVVMPVEFRREMLGLGGVMGLLRREIYVLGWLRKVLRDVSRLHVIAQVILPFLDYCLYAMALMKRPFGAVRWSGVAMRPSFHFSRMGIAGPPSSRVALLKERLYFRLLRSPTLDALFLIDPCLYVYTRDMAGAESPVCYVADPVSMEPLADKAVARARLGLRDTDRVVLAYGAMDVRKGVLELVRKLASAPEGSPLTALVVGRQSEAVRSFMQGPEAESLRRQGRLHEINRYVTDHEEAMVFSAADLVWLGYRGHYGSSGVLVQAAMAQRPVIASDEGCLAWLTRREHLGVLINVDDFSLGVFDATAYTGTLDTSMHSVERFQQALFAGKA